MKRLFLSSDFSTMGDRVPACFTTGNLKVLFIENAGDPFPDDGYIDPDIKAFKKLGFKVNKCDLRKVDKKQFQALVWGNDVIHFCGGSALYLMNLLREKGLDEIVVNSVNKGDIVYSGTSAGSMIAAKSIELCKDDIDERDAKQKSKQKNYNGLGLTSIYLVCHSQDKRYVKSSQALCKQLPKNNFPVIFVNDGMAIWQWQEFMELLKNENKKGK